MKILVEFDVPEGWDHYSEEQNLLSLTNWGATNDGVAAKIITDEQSKKVPEMIEALKVIRDSFWTEPSESKKHIELQDIAKSILKEIES